MERDKLHACVLSIYLSKIGDFASLAFLSAFHFDLQLCTTFSVSDSNQNGGHLALMCCEIFLPPHIRLVFCPVFSDLFLFHFKNFVIRQRLR